MLKIDKKQKVIENLQDAEENLLDSNAEYISNRDEEANHHLLTSIAESLLAIAYILAMKEDLYVYGEHIIEMRKKI